MSELLENDYANYMVQSLVSFSNSQQRFRIFSSLSDQIAQLVCLKQGTFALQQMISFINTEEEFQLFTKIIENNFFETCTDPNGNHFMRKLVATMPLSYNEIFIRKVFDKFVELVNNKNSVCVLKVFLKIISKEPQT